MFTEWISEPVPASAHSGHSVARTGHADVLVAAKEVTTGHQVPLHRHSVSQLMMVVRGIVSCEVASGLWIVPPSCALWIPAGAEHAMRSVGDVSIYCVYLEPARTLHLPQSCCTLSVSPLLRELVIETSRLPERASLDAADGRMVLTLLDQLARAEPERLHVPMPDDARLRKIADRLVANPADHTSVPEHARATGMSVRTFMRLVTKITGIAWVGRSRLS